GGRLTAPRRSRPGRGFPCGPGSGWGRCSPSGSAAVASPRARRARTGGPSRFRTSACPDVLAAAFREYGGPEVLRWEEVADPVCGSLDVLVEVRACGLNHSDLDSRAGTSRWPFTTPGVLGAEFAGYVREVGAE